MKTPVPTDDHPDKAELRLCRLGIDTYKEAVIYLREDSHVCISEGFEAHARIRVCLCDRVIVATLNMVKSDILEPGYASLSEYAWELLSAREGDVVCLSHAHPVASLSHVRSKIYGNPLTMPQTVEIINDISAGRYSDIHISSFLTACAGGRLSLEETVHLTRAMVRAGDCLSWPVDMVVDKHCVGGLPGNRTTPIVVAIVAAFGLTIPKTSSRAITSPAGTADTMEILAPVELDMARMRKVVEQQNGCIVWGGSVSLSPADDVLIRVEKALDIDSDGQLVASILSKKISAGSTHALIDIPVGETAKVRSLAQARALENMLVNVARELGMEIRILISDGAQPVGNGVGPALEARDVVAVLRNESDAPADLRERALTLAGLILEFSPDVAAGAGRDMARDILDKGDAWRKFQNICAAQGGMRQIPVAPYTHQIVSSEQGRVTQIDNRKIARLAKLAGAPQDAVAGLDLHVKLGHEVKIGDPLYTLHTASPGELAYVRSYIDEGNHIIRIGE